MFKMVDIEMFLSQDVFKMVVDIEMFLSQDVQDGGF